MKLTKIYILIFRFLGSLFLATVIVYGLPIFLTPFFLHHSIFNPKYKDLLFLLILLFFIIFSEVLDRIYDRQYLGRAKEIFSKGKIYKISLIVWDPFADGQKPDPHRLYFYEFFANELDKNGQEIFDNDRLYTLSATSPNSDILEKNATCICREQNGSLILKKINLSLN